MIVADLSLFNYPKIHAKPLQLCHTCGLPKTSKKCSKLSGFICSKQLTFPDHSNAAKIFPTLHSQFLTDPYYQLHIDGAKFNQDLCGG